MEVFNLIVYLNCVILPLSIAADQYKWLERDLAKVNREETPWLVATWHPPWYSTYTAHYKEVECMRIAMEELLYKSGVDLVFNGHVSLMICDLVT